MNRLGGRLSASTLGYRLRNALVAGKSSKNVVRASTSTLWSSSSASPFVNSWNNSSNSSFRFKSTAATAAYDQSVNAFPSIVIGPDRSIEPQGSFAEYVKVKHDECAEIPKDVSFEIAAASATESVTALQAIRDLGGLTKKSSILIIGAAGGVGNAAVQIAKNLGAHVTAVCGSKDVKKVKELGG